MAFISQLLFICVITIINAEIEWWVTGNPFSRTKAPAQYIPHREGTTWKSNNLRASDRPCQCTIPEYCYDYYDPGYPTDSRCDIEGDICCEKLRYAEPISGSPEDDTGVISNNGNKVDNPEDIGYESSEEYTEAYDTVHATSTSTTIKPTQSVISLSSVDQANAAKRKKWDCGKPYFQLNDKAGESQKSASFDATFAEFPWTLALFEETEDLGPIIRCAAVLIDSMLAVTAAHCFKQLERKKVIVRAGEWDLNNLSEPFEHQDRRARKIIMHEEYDPVNLENDIALIFLDKAFVEDRHIGVICLPKENEKITPPCIATGWGMRTNQVSSSLQNIMKKVELNFEFPDKCVEKLRKTDLGPTFSLPRNVVCASKVKEGIDTGYGDGGGPFFCKSPEENKFILVGLASWGKLDYPDAPGVYSSIYQQREWIERQRIMLVTL